ncbi:Na(+)/H(+) antiporter NhaA [Enterovibrio norvegicus FF-33]|uniref:Na(+)/H(+) antiporter NhaA n=1 Tax=Enterovibrio norvegicus FF-454 TaxID=1185651 RepID=A0A1E5BWE5_9GAMM|nr:Na+/H+ antiporter NhaA [Enterovibrio norvegicus]OEE57574.1 Na(+)/H(+) antiporter NhaA [Enterovibrio norvegicus FF-454]OEE69729.1 Na(+)/H(+) antiporter NhaA [Enterovibrio norvegicus FF-33]OEE85655.1 Na(+)/H(+) antiporter NhaA [Enterovibrio norvegicus FF-162]
MTDAIRQFMKMESAGGLVLIIAAILAIVIANSPLQPLYDGALHSYIAGLSVAHWINDGLMAIFFMLIGLEVKRELIEGALNTKEKAIFPAIAAVGGMLAPALVYLAFNYSDPVTINGWAIPAATDIAFALGVMALLGKRVPLSLKVFLLALAIIDDLGVIVVIALFYSSDLSITALVVAFISTAVLFLMNTKNVTGVKWYLLVGAILWFSVLKSGVHATLAGVVLGFAIPLAGGKDGKSPLKTLEHAIHPYAAFLILPLFAFANAGVSLEGVSLASLTNMLPLGIALGLLIGKPLGIFTFSWIAVKTGVARLPENVNFKQIFAVSLLCGIGFTMSIFISSLAFVGVDQSYITFSRLGILIGSTVSALAGYALLSAVLPKSPAAEEDGDGEKVSIDY